MIEADISTKLVGDVLETYYQNTLWKTENLRISRKMHMALEVFRGERAAKAVEVELQDESETAAKITIEDVKKFANMYSAAVYKYTRRHKRYSTTSKSWIDFKKACETATRLEVDYEVYFQLIRNYYVDVNKSQTSVLPFPRQLHGEWAENIIIEGLAKTSLVGDPEVKAKRRAHTNRYIPLTKDEEYLAVREKIKRNSYTLEDLKYAEARQIQAYGEAKDWLLTRIEALKSAQKDKDAADLEIDGGHDGQ